MDRDDHAAAPRAAWQATCPVCDTAHSFPTKGARMRRLITWECRIRDLVIRVFTQSRAWAQWEQD